MEEQTNKANRTVVLAIRITEEERDKLDALSDFLGFTKAKILMDLVCGAYEQNKDAIEIMLQKRAEAIAKSKS